MDDIDPGDPANIPFCFAFEFTQAAPHSCCLNILAPENIPIIDSTFATSHLEVVCKDGDGGGDDGDGDDGGGAGDDDDGDDGGGDSNDVVRKCGYATHVRW